MPARWLAASTDKQASSAVSFLFSCSYATWSTHWRAEIQRKRLFFCSCARVRSLVPCCRKEKVWLVRLVARIADRRESRLQDERRARERERENEAEWHLAHSFNRRCRQRRIHVCLCICQKSRRKNTIGEKRERKRARRAEDKRQAYNNKTELIDTTNAILYGWCRCCCDEHRVVLLVELQHFSQVLLKDIDSSRQRWWTETMCDQREIRQWALNIRIERSWNTVKMMVANHRWWARWRWWARHMSSIDSAIGRTSRWGDIDGWAILFEYITEFFGQLSGSRESEINYRAFTEIELDSSQEVPQSEEEVRTEEEWFSRKITKYSLSRCVLLPWIEFSHWLSESECTYLAAKTMFLRVPISLGSEWCRATKSAVTLVGKSLSQTARKSSANWLASPKVNEE